MHIGPEAALDLGPGGATYIVKFGMGSTSIHKEWSVSSPLFRTFIEFAAASIAAVPEPCELVGFCWCQGESDSSSAKLAREYKGRCIEMVQAVRSALAAPELPFIASEVLWRGKHLASVNASLAAAVLELQPAICTSSAGFEVGADGHLNTASILLLGRNFSAALQGVIERRCSDLGSASASAPSSCADAVTTRLSVLCSLADAMPVPAEPDSTTAADTST
jgi:hypothetical protein